MSPKPVSPKPAAEPIAGPPAAEIDLMSTVGPVLVKRYAKPVAAVAAAVALLVLLRRLFSG